MVRLMVPSGWIATLAPGRITHTTSDEAAQVRDLRRALKLIVAVPAKLPTAQRVREMRRLAREALDG